VATFWKQEDIRQELLKYHHAADCEVNSQIFHQDLKTEGLYIVEGSAPSKKKAEPTQRVSAGNVGALATLHIFAPTEQKEKQDDGDKHGPTGT
jgi:hypothetical protein